MAHTCNPSYSEHGDWKDHRPTMAKKLARSHLNNKPGMVAHTCNSHYMRGTHRRIVVHANPEQKVQDYLKNN
jgi:hypothetical protein